MHLLRKVAQKAVLLYAPFEKSSAKSGVNFMHLLRKVAQKAVLLYAPFLKSCI